MMGTSMVALTVVDDVRSVLKGPPHPEALTGPEGTYEVPVHDAACHVVIDAADGICAPDVSREPRLRDLPQIKEFEAAAWLGLPVLDPDGYVIGNFCAMDRVARRWTDEERAALRGLARAAGARSRCGSPCGTPPGPPRRPSAPRRRPRSWPAPCRPVWCPCTRPWCPV
ncbi:GAF domain-containing protein [Pseudonocardia sp. RS010]|uniref:GAF domain-containing protein n=1 Tax=Pseudonocardia sp. RS010 TaxID=3385979 RepID=UPI0039A3A283